MRYKLFGKSGLRVSELSLGTMTFGEEWGWGADKAESRKIFDAYVEAGGNFVDTANHYTNGTSEEYVGEFIRDRRQEMVLATKYTLNARPDDPNGGGNHRKSMHQALEASLKRLGTDYVDVYWVHAWDFMTPVDEVMRALDDMVRVGKVLYVGISDAPAWVVSQANTLADLRGWSRFAGLQIRHNLIDRTAERDLLPMARELDIAVTAWAPLSSGALSGKYRRGNKEPEGTRLSEGAWGNSMLTERNLDIIEVVAEIADELGRSPAQIAIRWLMQRSRQGVSIPIVGARKLSQITDNLAAIEFELTGQQIEQLNAVSAIELGFPHDFLSSDGVRQVVFGNTYDLIDNHRNNP